MISNNAERNLRKTCQITYLEKAICSRKFFLLESCPYHYDWHKICSQYDVTAWCHSDMQTPDGNFFINDMVKLKKKTNFVLNSLSWKVVCLPNYFTMNKYLFSFFYIWLLRSLFVVQSVYQKSNCILSNMLGL